jgi:hypothetical protein
MNIDRVGTWLLQNVVVLAAVFVVPLKMLVIRVCGDREQMALSFFAIPEDLCWVALGLVLGDVINGAGAFHKHYANSKHVNVDVVIVTVLGVGAALFVHLFGQLANANFRSWRAAQRVKSLQPVPNQEELAIPNGENNFHLLLVRYLAAFSFFYSVQFLFSGLLLVRVARIISAT